MILADLSGAEVAAILGSALGVLLVAAFFFAFVSLLRTLRTLLAAIEDLRREVVPLAGQWRRTVDVANSELTRLDGVITTAESVGSTVDSASRLAYMAFSNPVIKALAFGTGTARAVRAFRRPRDRRR